MAVTALSTLALKNARLDQVGTGLAFTAIDGTDGGSYVNTGVEMVIVRNAEAATNTVTFHDKDGVSMGTLTIPASVCVAWGPLAPALHNDANGKVLIKTGDATNCTFLVVAMDGTENTITA